MKPMLPNDLEFPEAPWVALMDAYQVMLRDPLLQQRQEAITRSLSLLAAKRREDPFLTIPQLEWVEKLDGCLDILAFLSLVPDVTRYWKDKGLSKRNLDLTFSDLLLWMEKHFASSGRWGVSAQGWLVHHFTGGLVRLGRLQYQLGRTADHLPTVNQGTVVLHVHIPEGEPLSPASCEESFQQAQEFFLSAFPAIQPQAFVCESWLLDPIFPSILPGESNIVHFQANFLISCNGGSDRQMRERVFGHAEADPLSHLPVTSLQNAIQMAWKRGERFQTAVGIRQFGVGS